jgi:hypothetical protein
MQPITLIQPERVSRAPIAGPRSPVPSEMTQPVRGGHVELSDQQFAHALKMGALVGIPIVFAVVVALLVLAVPGNVALLVAGLWPAIVGGPFFAGFAYVLVTEARCQPATSHALVQQTSQAPRRRAPVRLARLAH